MTTLIARHYSTGEPVRVELAGDRIASIAPSSEVVADDVFIAPGLVDLQVNGYGGRDFASPKLTVDDVRAISFGLDQHGVTGYLATITTQSRGLILHALATIAQARRRFPEVAQRLWGVHLEGPYISPEDGPRGAHPREHCRPPDLFEYESFQNAAEGNIKLLTLAPEYDESPEFIRKVAATGVLVAIGHTAANSDQIAAAVTAGARMSTHLGNGAHPLIKRHPNYIWDQLADDRLTASIIADGHHLPPAVVKCVVRMKTPARTVLVSDMTGMGGMPPGRYDTSLGAVEVLENGKLVVAGQRDLLAGAALSLEHCVAHAARCAEISRGEALAMASSRPASLVGENHDIQSGNMANLCLLRWRETGPPEILRTILRGKTVYSA